jgi:hypothetical protein
MIEGMLIINLDPPYMGFTPTSGRQAIPVDAEPWRHCTHEQIRNLLLDLDVITVSDPWPLRDCILRLPIVLSKTKLVKHGLLKLPVDVVVPLRRVG